MFEPTAYSEAHPRQTQWVGALISVVVWITLILGLGLSLVIASVARSSSGEPAASSLFWVPYGFQWLAVTIMLVIVVMTMPNPRGYEWNADFSGVPTLLRWPLMLGNWIAVGLGFIASVVAILNAATSAPGSNARFSLSLLSLLGALAALLSSGFGALPGAMVLMMLWGVCVVLLFMRGLLGLFRWLPERWLKSRDNLA